MWNHNNIDWSYYYTMKSFDYKGYIVEYAIDQSEYLCFRGSDDKCYCYGVPKKLFKEVTTLLKLKAV